MEDERARFEAWVKKTSGLYPAKDEKGDYLTTIVWHWWAGWNAQSERIARLEEALRTCLTELEELNKGIGWRDGEWHAVTVARKALEQQ